MQFTNQNSCNHVLEKKKKLMSVNKTKLDFKPDVAVYISENLILLTNKRT